MRTQQIGRYGEDLAARFLIKQGFKILARNWRTRYGELDLVVRLGQVIHFVEVKTRTSLKTGEPEEAINHFKLRRLQAAAQSFLGVYKLNESFYQFDSVAVVLNLKIKTARIRFTENIFL